MLRIHSAKVQNASVLQKRRIETCSTGTTFAISSPSPRTGSTLAAGRRLRVSQTTAARRVAALEEALGLALFERRPAGYVLTPAGEALMASAERGSRRSRFADAAAAQSREISGTVRLTVERSTPSPCWRRSCATCTRRIRRSGSSSTPARRSATSPPARPTSRCAARSTERRRAGRPSGRRRRLGDLLQPRLCRRAWPPRHPPGAARPSPDRRRRQGRLAGLSPWLERRVSRMRSSMHHNRIGLLAAVRAGIGLAVLPTLRRRPRPGPAALPADPAGLRARPLAAHPREAASHAAGARRARFPRRAADPARPRESGGGLTRPRRNPAAAACSPAPAG